MYVVIYPNVFQWHSIGIRFLTHCLLWESQWYCAVFSWNWQIDSKIQMEEIKCKNVQEHFEKKKSKKYIFFNNAFLKYMFYWNISASTKWHFYRKTYWNIPSNNSNLEITEVFFNRWPGKWTTIHNLKDIVSKTYWPVKKYN